MVIPENSQANNIEVNPITLNKSKDKVNFIKEDDIRINKNNFFNSPTNILSGKEGFILASILPLNYPLMNYEVALLVL